MKPGEWRQWCRGEPDLRTTRTGVLVTLGDERTHLVHISHGDDTLELASVVARGKRVGQSPDAELAAWERNRGFHRVGLGFDARTRLVARTWLPKPGLIRQEFLLAVRHVAEEADLLEFQLTGRDLE